MNATKQRRIFSGVDKITLRNAQYFRHSIFPILLTLRSIFLAIDTSFSKRYVVFLGFDTSYAKEHAVVQVIDLAYTEQCTVFFGIDTIYRTNIQYFRGIDIAFI